MDEQATLQEKKRWFEVDVAGMREFHGARKGWQLAKELVSNSFDEDVSFCQFDLTHDGTCAHLTVEDDGPGFRDVADAYTLLGSTYKRARPDLRGRFNLGEKEIIAVSSSATVETAGRRIIFAENGERLEEQSDRKRGTRVELVLPWSQAKIERTITRMKRLLPPKNVKYTVNGTVVPYRESYKTFEASLETVLLEHGVMRKTVRKTMVHLHKPSFGDRPMLFELGIPIQAIDCGFHIDVQQKIPMNPNRDAVKPHYLKHLYAEVLNHTVDEVPEDKISQEWVRQAVEDKRTAPEVVKQMKKKFGEKALLWSNDTQSNEKAVEAGYDLIRPKTLSPTERERFVEVGGLKHASDIFSSNGEGDDRSKEVKANEDMQQIATYTKQLAIALVSRDIRVRFYSKFGEGVAASYNQAIGTLSFNVATLGYEWFKQGVTADTTAVILHEVAHEARDPDYAHGPVYRRNLETLAGKAVMLALEQLNVFSTTPANGSQGPTGEALAHCSLSKIPDGRHRMRRS